MSPELQESPEQPGTSKSNQSAKVGKPISRKARLFHGRFRFSKLIAAAAVLAAGLLVLVPGVWERTFRSRTYGAMRLELSLPAETPEEWGEAAGARLYRETAEGLEDLGTVRLRPRNDGGLAGRVMYYPQGAYRIRWNLGDSVVWTSLHLPSLAGLKLQNLRFLSVRERLGKPPVFPLSLKWTVRSALNNRDLTDFAVMKWERLDQPGGSLESGGRYRITFSVPGFSDTVFPVTADPWRRELRLDAVIWPLPGRLRIINSSGRTILPRLNHKNVYLEQTPIPHTQRSTRLPAGEERLMTILPGGYFLTPGLGRESELFLRVPSNSLKTVVVTQNVDGILQLEVTESSP